MRPGAPIRSDVNLLLTALKPVPAAEKFVADSSGVTPLHRAVSAHAAESVDALLKDGHDPNVASSAGSTPLHLAAIDGDLASATLLTAAGAHLDSRDSQGNTPLLRATSARHFEMAKYLLQQGADARIRNSNSASAYDLARAQSGAAMARDVRRTLAFGFVVAHALTITSRLPFARS